MWKMRCSSRVLLVAATGLAAAGAPALLPAGSRIAPVGAICPSDRPERAIDAEGEHDRCVARAAAKCPSGAELRTDATGNADVCVVAGSVGGTTSGKDKAPKCASGFRLQAATGQDICEKSGPPLCPSGSRLKTGQGEDQCRY